MSIMIELLVSIAALNFIITGIEYYIKYSSFLETPVRTAFDALSAVCAVLLFFLHLNTTLDKYENNKQIKIEVDSVQIKEIPYHKLKATYYNPVQSQCDGNPLITGSGYRINLEKLKKGNLKVVAVSRDLLKVYPYGSTIYVHQPVHLRGTYKVEDTMNSRFKNRIDFLVYDKLNVDSVHISI
jgi:3D (Asp-Asp-Asp) domain-containing protein